MTKLPITHIFCYLDEQCPSDLVLSRLIEFIAAGDFQDQYDECVRNNYNLSVFDDWMHLQNLLGVKLDYIPAMKIRRILADCQISISALQNPKKIDDNRLYFNLKQAANAASRTVDVYRLKKDLSDTANMMLMSFAFILAQSFVIDSSKYDRIYSGPIYHNEDLEDVYCRLHTTPPIELPGHSINKSDVIVIHEAGKRCAYFVDTYDFKELSNFFPN